MVTIQTNPVPQHGSASTLPILTNTLHVARASRRLSCGRPVRIHFHHGVLESDRTVLVAVVLRDRVGVVLLEPAPGLVGRVDPLHRLRIRKRVDVGVLVRLQNPAPAVFVIVFLCTAVDLHYYFQSLL